MNENIIKQIKECEGFSATAYKDSLGYETIGYGKLIDKRKGGGITEDEASYLLRNDIENINKEINKNLPWAKNLNEARYGVLVNMAFQMGINGLLSFKSTLALIEVGYYEAAAVQMLKSKWAKQTPERAKKMSEQIKTGEWQ